jgi:hypothetical protein
MKKDYNQSDEQPVRGDERSIIATSVILFIISTILRQLGPGGASCL